MKYTDLIPASWTCKFIDTSAVKTQAIKTHWIAWIVITWRVKNSEHLFELSDSQPRTCPPGHTFVSQIVQKQWAKQSKANQINNEF